MVKHHQIAIVNSRFMTMDAIGAYEVLKFLPDVELRFVSHNSSPLGTDRSVLVVGTPHSFQETPKPNLILAPWVGSNHDDSHADGGLIAWFRPAYATSAVPRPTSVPLRRRATVKCSRERSGRRRGAAGTDPTLALTDDAVGREQAEIGSTVP